MKRLSFAILAFALTSGFAVGEERIAATLHKQPGCQCCDAYADYLRENGFAVTVLERRDAQGAGLQSSIRKDLQGCHTTVIDKYIVEGHVPVGPIKRLLAEKPNIRGIALPGMPQGSPGMPGPKDGPFEIRSITDGDGPAPLYMTE